MFEILNGKVILITGGTGSFGQKFTELALKNSDLEKLILLSRDEMKQWKMAENFHDARLRFFLGDVRDKSRLEMAFRGVDIVIHAAALKIVGTAEYNPFECINTNVFGAMNVIDAAISSGVNKVAALSTDKSSNPVNLYGASKLCSDKLFIAANNYVGRQDCVFSVVRYGNVMGSRGSVIPRFVELNQQNKPLVITDERMTRFMISLEQSIDLVLTALSSAKGGEIFVKKIPSMNILDIAKAVNPSAQLEKIGIRPGEKLHEQMIGIEDAYTSFCYNGFYKILPQINDWHRDNVRIGNGISVPEDFVYSSDKNTEWMSVDQLAEWVKQNF